MVQGWVHLTMLKYIKNKINLACCSQDTTFFFKSYLVINFNQQIQQIWGNFWGGVSAVQIWSQQL